MSLAAVPAFLDAVVFLKTGHKLNVVLDPNRAFTERSLGPDTLQSFINGRDKQYFVQGGNIAYIEVTQ